jgi:hypothetical protein
MQRLRPIGSNARAKPCYESLPISTSSSPLSTFRGFPRVFSTWPKPGKYASLSPMTFSRRSNASCSGTTSVGRRSRLIVPSGGLSAFAEHVEPEQHIDLVKQDPTTTNPRVRSGQRVGISCERRQASVEGRAISRDKNCDAGRFHRGNSAAEPGTVAASRFELIGLTWTFI